MSLCLGLIEDALGRNPVFKSYAQEGGLFNLERQEIYKAGAFLNAGVLYITRSGSLSEGFSADGDSALICLGTPRKTFL